MRSWSPLTPADSHWQPRTPTDSHSIACFSLVRDVVEASVQASHPPTGGYNSILQGRQAYHSVLTSPTQTPSCFLPTLSNGFSHILWSLHNLLLYLVIRPLIILLNCLQITRFMGGKCYMKLFTVNRRPIQILSILHVIKYSHFHNTIHGVHILFAQCYPRNDFHWELPALLSFSSRIADVKADLLFSLGKGAAWAVVDYDEKKEHRTLIYPPVYLAKTLKARAPGIRLSLKLTAAQAIV